MLKENMNVQFVHGISPEISQKLAKMGIDNLFEFLESCRQKKGREQLAKKLGISYEKLYSLANRTDLMRVRGISDSYSELLDIAGVDRVQGLRTYDAASLDALLEQTSEKHDLPYHITKKAVAGWIQQAKKLQPALLDDGETAYIPPSGNAWWSWILAAIAGLLLGWLIAKYILPIIPGSEPVRSMVLIFAFLGLLLWPLIQMIWSDRLSDGRVFLTALYIPIILSLLPLLNGNNEFSIASNNGSDTSNLPIEIPLPDMPDKDEAHIPSDSIDDDSEDDEEINEEDTKEEDETVAKETPPSSTDEILLGIEPINRAQMAQAMTTWSNASMRWQTSKCFPDIKDIPEAKSICYAAKRGWVKGYRGGLYKPEKTITRAEAAVMMANFLDLDVPEELTRDVYEDVSKTDWYGPHIRALKNEGLILRTPEFEPFEPARGDWVARMFRLAGEES